jgi:hypothetical protein
MSGTTRRIASTAGALVLAGGVAFATASPAQAYDYSYTMSKAEVVEKKQMIDAATFGCNFLPGWAGAACGASGGTMVEEIRRAYYNECGLKVYVTATGSGMSYDKASYDFGLAC